MIVVINFGIYFNIIGILKSFLWNDLVWMKLMLTRLSNYQVLQFYWHIREFLTIIPRAETGSESIAYAAEGRMGY